MEPRHPPNPSSRPPSPARRTAALPGIADAAPGPNAFAQQAERLERHRLQGNAFYQQEVERRRITPPTAIHPALRPQDNSNPPAPLMINTDVQRESTVTTMSPFINAGMAKSPQLKLEPSSAQLAEPTQRGVIEEHREQVLHEAVGSDEERIPVYNTYAPTPKPASAEFAKPAASPHKPRISLPKKGVTVADASKSPKWNLFEKLRGHKHSASSSPALPATDSGDGQSEENDVPPKAQAVLGASSSKTNLARTPSKQKRGLLGLRKIPEVTDITTSNSSVVPKSASTNTDDAPRSGSSIARTPHTAVSDPTRDSFQLDNRLVSQTLSDRAGPQVPVAGGCIVQRSQSLKYMDAVPPPTPPAKNTPPHEKAKQGAAKSVSKRVPFHQTESTPSEGLVGIISSSDRLSPTKFGSYGHKETPRLVTRPSINSMHASVVPALNDSTTFEDMKARIDGLGLEGFNMPAETHYHRSPEMAYSPSIYSTDWGARPSVAFSPRHGHRRTMDDLPTVVEVPSDKASSSSDGTIPMFYPGLSTGPAVNDDESNMHSRPEASVQPRSQLRANIEENDYTPTHGNTHSSQHSYNPRHSMYDIQYDEGYENSPHYAEGVSQLSARSFAVPRGEETRENIRGSPGSFSCRSAMPSPLHYLPTTTYTPLVSQRARARREGDLTSSATGYGSRPGRNTNWQSASDSRPRITDIMQSAPVLAAHRGVARSAIPRPSISGRVNNSDKDLGPTKPNAASPQTDKQDQVLDILNKILANNEGMMTTLRDDMRAAFAPIEERLTIMEGVQNQAMPVSYGLDGASGRDDDEVDNKEHKQDQMVDMLNKVLTGNEGMWTMIRDEMRDATGRLDERLTTMEGSQNPPLSASHGHDVPFGQHDDEVNRKKHRIATSFAHEYYRQASPDVTGGVGNTSSPTADGTTASSTIAELQEENRKLMEMVHGLAAKFEDMQKKMGGGS